MKDEHWLIAIALLFLAGIGVAMHLETRRDAWASRAAVLQQELRERELADAAALRLGAPLSQYRISSPAGIRRNPLGGGEEGMHRGVDLVGPSAAPVLAAADGIVVDHWPPPGGRWHGHPVFGGLVILDHGGGVFTLYGHLRRTLVHTGDAVIRGQVIGIQGSTGISLGEHLHFEVVVDPEVALRGVLPKALER